MTRLPSSIPNDEETLNQLGHIWYADMEIGKFVEVAQKQQPQTLFVLTGDHGERFNFATQVSLEAQSGVPCIFYGPGVTKSLLPDTMTGSHLQIMLHCVNYYCPKAASIIPCFRLCNIPTGLLITDWSLKIIL
jgi:phosphoglycerol transferase MdoB-like AlkP superfamily enzyme